MGILRPLVHIGESESGKWPLEELRQRSRQDPQLLSYIVLLQGQGSRAQPGPVLRLQWRQLTASS